MMKVKVSNIFMGLLTALALSACSDEVDVVNDPIVDESNSQFMAVEITTTRSGGSRANTKDDNENEANYERGTENENKVKNLRFYFFDAAGQPVNVNANGTANFVNVDRNIGVEEPGNGAPEGWPNVEKKLQTIIVLHYTKKEEDNSTTTGLKSMVAVANYDRVKDLGNDKMTLSDLQGIIGNYEEDGTNPFIMTSSVFGADSYNCQVEVKSENLQNTEGLAMDHPVTMYIERVVAKVRAKADWDKQSQDETKKMETIQLKYAENENEKKKTYEAVLLKNKEGQPYKVGGKEIYAIFLNWRVTGTAKQSYLFKNVDGWADWNADFDKWFWNNPIWFRSYWAINPSRTWDKTSLDTYYLQYYPYKDISGIIGNNEVIGENEYMAGTTQYCQENAGDPNNAGMKAKYNGDLTLSNLTQAIFTAVLVQVKEGTKDEAESVIITEWGTQRRIGEASLKMDLLNEVKGHIYKRKPNTEQNITNEKGEVIGTEWQTEALSVDDVEFEYVGSELVQNGRRYSAYLKLTENAATGKTYYMDREGTKPYTNIDEVNDIFRTLPPAKVYPSGHTYYYHDIEHLGDNDLTGKYGIVRNHIYEINLKHVYGLGTPVYVPDGGKGEDIIPEKPSDDETYLAAKINILSWRVVNNNATLDWD